MNQPVLLILLGILVGIGIWQLVVWFGEIRQKNRSYRAASAYAQNSDKPMLVAGGPLNRAILGATRRVGFGDGN